VIGVRRTYVLHETSEKRVQYCSSGNLYNEIIWKMERQNLDKMDISGSDCTL
jgi:hypothetical protein